MSPGDTAVSVCMSAGKVIAEQADRIAELEAKVREMEAEVAKEKERADYAWRNTNTIDQSRMKTEAELAASRQQVERLVEALNKIMREAYDKDTPAFIFSNIAEEAIAAVEKERGNAEVSGAGTASAGLPSSADD